MPHAERRANGERGFTLAEALIALAVLGVGLILAGSILVQAHRMLHQASVEARTPAAELVLARLRSELQSAEGVAADTGPPLDRARNPLELLFPDGRRVRYERWGSELRRRELVPAKGAADPGGDGGDRSPSRGRAEWSAPRRVLGGVTSWRWNQVGRRLVTVEIAYRSPGAGDRIVDPARSSPRSVAGEAEVRRTLVAALRGGGLGWGW
jgi:prepilin-type N-terminal cleavage/methylation domain-containing protein